MKAILDWKEDLKSLISENKLNSVFEILKKDISQNSIPYNEIILKNSVYLRIEESKRNGLISFEEEMRQSNRIKFFLLSFIDSITEMNFKDHSTLLEEVPQEESDFYEMLIDKIEHLEKGILISSEILNGLKESNDDFQFKVEQLEEQVLNSSEVLENLKKSSDDSNLEIKRFQKISTHMGCLSLLLITIFILLIGNIRGRMNFERHSQLIDKIENLNSQFDDFKIMFQDDKKNINNLDSLIPQEQIKLEEMGE